MASSLPKVLLLDEIKLAKKALVKLEQHAQVVVGHRAVLQLTIAYDKSNEIRVPAGLRYQVQGCRGYLQALQRHGLGAVDRRF